MSVQSFNNPANNFVYFNKQPVEPFAPLNVGVLYEKQDGILYFNTIPLIGPSIGNVTSESIPSVANSVVMYADTTGTNVEESILLVDQNTSNPYPMVRLGVNDPSGPPAATIIGYCDQQGNLIGWGSYMSDAIFMNSNITNNLFFGYNSGLSLTGEEPTDGNISFGYNSLNSLVYGSKNICLGNQALQFLFAGNNNISLGDNSGSNLNAEEANNFYIFSKGVATENNTTRINDNTSDNPATSFYAGGIYGVTPTVPQMCTVSATGQLGSLALPTSYSPNIGMIYTWNSGNAVTMTLNTKFQIGYASTFTGDVGWISTSGSTLNFNGGINTRCLLGLNLSFSCNTIGHVFLVQLIQNGVNIVNQAHITSPVLGYDMNVSFSGVYVMTVGTGLNIAITDQTANSVITLSDWSITGQY